jgi:hypothetical protein
MGPTLPAELRKPPFGRKTAGWMVFFFGPIAGSLVASISLRRLGHAEKGKKILLFTLLASVPIAVVLMLTPSALSRFVGIGIEAGAFAIFSKIQDREFAEWQSAHPELTPTSGWKALGWGLLGLIMFVVIVVGTGVLMDTLGIHGAA